MKISEMAKPDLVQYMKASGEIHRINTESEAWRRAFYLCKNNGNEHLTKDCKKCWAKVDEWLRK